MSNLLQAFTDTQGDAISARMFPGMVIDGVTDTTAVMQDALWTCAALGAPLALPGDAQAVCSNLFIPTGLLLVTKGYGSIKQTAAAAANGVPFITTVAASLNPWIASTTYALAAIIIDPAGHAQRCVLAGTSGSSIPTFSDSGGTVAEGTGKPSWADQGVAGNILLEGITFDGNSTNQPGISGAHIIDLINASNVTIRNCNFRNSTGRCVSGQKLNGLTIEGGHYVNWQPGNYGAIQLWGTNDGLTGGPISNVRISGVTIDGTVSGSTCIKLSGGLPDSRFSFTANAPLSHVYVGGGTKLYMALGSVLGLEFYSYSNVTGTYSDVVVDGIEVYGGNSGGIGLSFSDGGVLSTCTDFAIDSCAIGIEAYASTSVFCNGTINNPQIGVAINGSYENRSNVTVSHVKISSPTQNGVLVYASNDSGFGPFEDYNILLDDIDVIAIPTNGIGIYFLCNATGAAIINSKVHNCRLIGTGGATNTVGVVFNANSQVLDSCAVELCWLDVLTYGISVTDTNGRFLLNRFSSTVTTQYNGIGGSDYVVSADPSSASGPLVASVAPGGDALRLICTTTGVIAIEGVIQGSSGPTSYPRLDFKDPSGVVQASIQLDGAATFFNQPVAVGATSVSAGYEFGVTGKAYITGDTLLQAKFGCNGAGVQAAAASGGAVVTTASTQVTPYGFTTPTQADGLVALVNAIRAALVANGIMS